MPIFFENWLCSLDKEQQKALIIYLEIGQIYSDVTELLDPECNLFEDES